MSIVTPPVELEHQGAARLCNVRDYHTQAKQPLPNTSTLHEQDDRVTNSTALSN
jgi:hypothetical protein